MDGIEKTKTSIMVKRGSNLMYNCTANSVVHLSTTLDDKNRIEQAKKDIDDKIEKAKKIEGYMTISHRIGLISFNEPKDTDLNPVQGELVQFYRNKGYRVILGIMSYHLESTHYLTMEIKL